jgi:hypothetical protein
MSDKIIPSVETLTGGTANRFLIAGGAGTVVGQETAAQVKTRLDLTGTNSGDQTLSSLLGLPVPSVPVGTQRFSGLGINVQGSSGTLTANRLYAMRVAFPAGVNRIGISQLSNGAAGTVHRVLVYTDSSGEPGTLLADSGTLAADSGSLVVKEAAVSFTYDVGRIYWLCGVTNSAGNIARTNGVPVWYASANGGGSLPRRTASYDPTTTPPATFGAASWEFASAVWPVLTWGCV